jgi:DNA-binding CsgD family transcriptional regulator
MKPGRRSLTRSTLGLAVLVAIQLFCAFYFISDVLSSLVGFSARPIPWQLREVLELAVSAGMLVSLGLGLWVLRQTLRERNRAETGLRRAAGAFAQLMDERFTHWGLTPAERDVALFAIKGLSMAEIAALRETSEGTVRAQANAIYRKAGVTGRQQLLSHFIDELLSLDNSYGATVLDEAARSGLIAPVARRA